MPPRVASVPPPAAVSSSLLWMMYGAHTLSSFGDRMWGFAAPILFTMMFPGSLLPAALFNLCTRLPCVLFGQTTGRWVDESSSRLRVVQIAVLGQNLLVGSCSALFLVLLPFRSGAVTDDLGDDDAVAAVLATSPLPMHEPVFVVAFVLIAVCGAVAELLSSVEAIAVRKDWVPILCQQDSELLATTNATMRRISLCSEIVAPLFFGTVTQLLSAKDLRLSLGLVALWNILSCVPEMLLFKMVYDASPALQAPRVRPAARPVAATAATSTVSSALKSFFLNLSSASRSYLRQSVLLPSLSLVLLYFTVLDPAPLLTAFLTTRGVSASALGVWRGASAVFGISATLLTPALIRRLGVVSSGAIFIILLWLLTTCAFLLVVSGASWAIYAFLGCLVLSRMPLYAFDLVEVQLMQEGILEHERGVVNSTESSLYNLMIVLVYLLGVLFSRPSQFVYLMLASLGAYCLSALTYVIWMLSAARRQFEARRVMERSRQQRGASGGASSEEAAADVVAVEMVPLVPEAGDADVSDDEDGSGSVSANVAPPRGVAAAEAAS